MDIGTSVLFTRNMHCPGVCFWVHSRDLERKELLSWRIRRVEKSRVQGSNGRKETTRRIYDNEKWNDIRELSGPILLPINLFT